MEAIAIIGMAGRFPGAPNVERLWHNLRSGVESISRFTPEELSAGGLAQRYVTDPDFVPAAGVIEDFDRFDARFFGFTPRDAVLLDPQHRLLLECAWEALEDAAYDPERYSGLIGVFAGSSRNAYARYLLGRNSQSLEAASFDVLLGNEKDFLASRIGYKLDLRGPCVSIQTACSTSLVAVVSACRSLLHYECDMALAGGVTVAVPHKRGHVHQPGGIGSPDGHCRAFDTAAQGTVNSSGLGVVLLKRLSEAVADRDPVRAVILGSAMNNDGAVKVGFTAPSVDGQARAIEMAHAAADVEPASISFVETHGTGTRLGDPIEIAALSQVFDVGERSGPCWLGALKTNIGHLDAAAGIAGLIKATLALGHDEIPPTLHFRTPNPELKLDAVPFVVNTEPVPWPRTAVPRRAGVSSFGIGGTNAHVVLEEAPVPQPGGPARPWSVLALSAQTPVALDQLAGRIAQHLRGLEDGALADVAYTLQVGRKALPYRRSVACRDIATAVQTLEPQDGAFSVHGVEAKTMPVAFLFSGQGSQHLGMGLALYEDEPVFRQTVDQCSALLLPSLGRDLRDVLYPKSPSLEGSAELLRRTDLAQPALFVVEYALAELWRSWGVRPVAVLGHSLGEYTAACIAGVFQLEDALSIVAARGRLMQACEPGAMLAVELSEAEVVPLLEGGLALAAVNRASGTVVSGPEAAVATLELTLGSRMIACRRLVTSHAFHSPMMDPALAAFSREVARVRLTAPRIPIISNVSGQPLERDEAMDPEYWVRHLRSTVRFADGLNWLLENTSAALLEIGPGRSLATAARHSQSDRANRPVMSSLPHPDEHRAHARNIYSALGALWSAGVSVDWAGFHEGEVRRRVHLPTYPFQRERYWPDGAPTTGVTQSSAPCPVDLTTWFSVPSWTRTAPLRQIRKGDPPRLAGQWLVLTDGTPLSRALSEQLTVAGSQVTIVRPDTTFRRLADAEFCIAPGRQSDCVALMRELRDTGRLPDRVLHLWSSGEAADGVESWDTFSAEQANGFYTLLWLAQELTRMRPGDVLGIDIVTSRAFSVEEGDDVQPERSTIDAACRGITQEYPQLRCRVIDLASAWLGHADTVTRAVATVLAEIAGGPSTDTVAHRLGHRWSRTYVPTPIPPSVRPPPILREGGVYLITGGLGKIGLRLARFLVAEVRAKVVLVGRTAPESDAGGRTTAPRDAIAMMEAAGGDVLVLQADVGDLAQVQAAIAETRRRFGRMHGVIHCAGVTRPESFRVLRDLDVATCETHFAPKARGLLTLRAAIPPGEVDFWVLCSSISTVLGGLGFTPYAAANAFLDAFAEREAERTDESWISIGWDAWDFGDKRVPDSGKSLEFSLRPDEGCEAFQRVLAECTSARVVVSTGDLATRVARWVTVSPETGLLGSSLPPHFSRPATATAYAPPADETERIVVNLWERLLGIQGIGIHDDFFELGGHSLVAIQLMSRLRQQFRIEVSLQALFDGPTVAELSNTIREQALMSDRRDPLIRALERVESVSEAEARSLLQEYSGTLGSLQ